MANRDSLEVFSKAPVPTAVLKNALPAMAAMIMVLVYNLADTFFIGQTHDPLQLAAVSLATPVFLIFLALGIIFGIGGTSVISRAMGEGRFEYAKKVSSFCMWGCIVTGAVVGALMIIFVDSILELIGASPDTWDLARSYLVIVAFSGPFVLVSNCYSNVVRADGQSGKAMMGVLLGNVVNIVLDPIMILGLGWNIAGAAVATVAGNVVAAVYYIPYLLGKKTNLSIRFRDFTMGDGVFKNVMAIGIPAALGAMLMSVSQIVVNAQIVEYSDLALAGIGVAMKITMISGVFAMGLGQGVQPLLGFCAGAKMWPRFKAAMRFSLVFGTVLSLVFTGACYLFMVQIVGAFLVDQEAFAFAALFARILLSTGFLFGVFFVVVSALQAMGASTLALIVNVSRQGLIFIPMTFILNALLGMIGLVWAQPVTDILALLLACVLYRRSLKRMMAADATHMDLPEMPDEVLWGNSTVKFVVY